MVSSSERRVTDNRHGVSQNCIATSIEGSGIVPDVALRKHRRREILIKRATTVAACVSPSSLPNSAGLP